MIQYIREPFGLSSIKSDSTILFEDNVACIAQITGGHIKKDRTKHISSKLFYTHEHQKISEISVQQIRSIDNLTDLFTKSFPTSTLKMSIHKIGIHQHDGEFACKRVLVYCTFFPFIQILSRWVLLARFLMRKS